MTRKKPHQQAAAPVHKEEAGATQNVTAGKKRFDFKKFATKLPYLLSFLTLWIFCTFTYGEVFTRTVQESYITSDAHSMKFLTDQANGQLYVFGRYCLLLFHNKWIGGLIFSLLLTFVVRLLDYALCIPKWLRGFSILFPYAYLLYWVQQDINIYYKNEPSLFVLQGIGLLVFSFLFAGIRRIVLHKLFPARAIITPQGWRKYPIGACLVVLSFIPFNLYTLSAAENTILTAKMQNRVLNNDVYALGEDGLSAKRPSRSVAAYCAIGLTYTDQLLEHIFDLRFNYPKVDIHTNEGDNEYGIFTADCNFYAGLLNSSYHSAFDQVVMNGPRLYYLKRLAICSILNREKALANKYLTMIEQVPFEQDFVDTYRPMIENPDLIAQEPSFNKVLSLRSQESKFEQNYRTPTFLGYLVGVFKGNNDILAPSIAACLYSKDLANMAERVIPYKKMNTYLPMAVQEALSIYGRKNPVIYKYFPELNDDNKMLSPAVINVNNFYQTIQQYFMEKANGGANWSELMSEEIQKGISDELRAYLDKDWLGHYVYYYYCENIARQEAVKSEGNSVN